jgi:hypothetical protein
VGRASGTHGRGEKILQGKRPLGRLFADDQVTMSDSEYNLQTAVYKLNRIITEYG